MMEKTGGRERRQEKTRVNINISYKMAILTLIILLLFGILLSISVGDVNIAFKDIFKTIFSKEYSNSMERRVILDLRLPRTLLSIVVGIGLGVCGTVMQASVQNSLADPYILGISSGASFGATFYILLGFKTFESVGQLGISMFAFLGGILAAFLVISLASIGGKTSSMKLVLAGTVISALCTAFSNFMIYIGSSAEGIKSVTFWTMGSLGIMDIKSVVFPFIIVLIGTLYFLTQTRNLNTMMVGEEAAITLGINLNKYRKIYIVISVMITSILVSRVGIIGFVGLVIPHISRGMVGSNNRKLLPIAILNSGVFLLYADILSRILIENGEIPIGIITSIIGAPIFIYILMYKDRKYVD